MTKDELIHAVQDQLRPMGYDASKPVASAAVDAVVGAVAQALVDGEEVKLAGFGRFGVVERSARTTKVFGEVKQVAASRAAKFYPAPAFKARLNG